MEQCIPAREAVNKTPAPPSDECKESNPMRSAMTNRTVVNETYRGLVEEMAIPAELHERDGYRYASFGSAVPIHSCTPEQVTQYGNVTHHYCSLFTEQTLAPLDELVYVRLDDAHAEKVFINRAKRLLLTSSDGILAQWRAAPTFESANTYIAGTPIVNKEGALVSLVTARRGNNYAVSNIEGDGGYFDTPVPWTILDTPAGQLIYGERGFESRELLREYIQSLPDDAGNVDKDHRPIPVLHRAPSPRILLQAAGGRQIAHYHLQSVLIDGIDYL